jgi:hypothetical protein
MANKMKKFADGGELPQDKTDRIAREENEDDKKLLRKIAGAGLAVPAGLAGVILSAHPDMPGPIDSAKLGAKTVYHSITGNKKGEENALNEAKAAMKRDKNVERKYNTGETTNAAGDSYKKGGKVSSASKRADGCAVRGKTKGRMV